MPSAKELFQPLTEALDAGRLDEAQRYKDTLRENPRDAIALTLLARIAAAEGDIIGGLAMLGEALRVEPFYEPAYRYRAELFWAIGHQDRVVQDLESLMLYYPIKPELVSNYAQMSFKIGRLDHASAMLRTTSLRDADNAFFANLSGLALQQSRRFEDAIEFYRRAMNVDPANAHYSNNLGTCYHALDRYDEAQSVLERSIAVDPDFEMAWYNLGNVFKDTRRFVDAERCYRRAIELRSDYPDARLNLGCILIQHNRWAEGWKQYEYRWNVPNLLAQPAAALPRWQGESLAGKHLVVSAEQGIGDTLQFVRYLREAATLGARITFICPENVTGLLSRFHPDIKVVNTSDFGNFGGYWVPLMNLPALLKAAPEAIPPAPYLEVEEDRVKYFLAKLGPAKNKLRIGIVWGGNAAQQDDHHRSVPLERLSALFELENVRWIGLQKGPHLAELADADVPVEDWSGELDDFDDTGALMKALDGVVTMCSSPLHLAGALGIRTLAMLNWAADWRWGLDDDHTPWYPSVKLLRQSTFGDWESVAEKAVREIATWKALPQPQAEDPDLLRRPAPTVRAKTHYGTMDLMRHDTYITTSLASAGEYCQDEINLLGRYVNTGSVVVEAGANIGAHTLPLGRLIGEEGVMHSFEPQFEAFRLLKRNVERAALGNVVLHRAAIGDKEGTAHVPYFSYRERNNYGGVKLTDEGDTVPCLTIDGLNLERCDLIKLDVEGCEPEAVAGAMETIKRCRPVLYIEDQFTPESKRLRESLRELGYRIFSHRALLNAGGAVPVNRMNRTFTEWSASNIAIPPGVATPRELAECTD